MNLVQFNNILYLKIHIWTRLDSLDFKMCKELKQKVFTAFKKWSRSKEKLYHSCFYKNRNGTRKHLDYGKGEKCICPSNNSYWHLIKENYSKKPNPITRQFVKTLMKDNLNKYVVDFYTLQIYKLL